MEMLGLQGIWREDCKNQDAFDTMMVQKLAQDFAGNAMTGTVAQAVVLAALSSSDAFLKIDRAPASPPRTSPDAMVEVDSPAFDQPASDAATGSDERVENGKERKSRKRKQQDEKDTGKHFHSVPTRRLRGKQTVLNIPSKPPKKGRGHGRGNQKAKGKCPTVSIFQKEAICKAYDHLVEQGSTKPGKELENMNMTGYYKGCTFPSKWGDIRKEQRWTLLCETAPKLCKAKKELPNSLRLIIHHPTLKSGNKPMKSEEKTIMPFVLKQVVEELVMERVDTGEEVCSAFVQNTILWCCNLWNKNMESMREMIQSKSLDMLKAEDERLAQLPMQELDAMFQAMSKKVDEMLVPVTMFKSSDALRSLG